MTFLNPWAFGFLAAMPVIVALYLLKIKRRSVPVSTLMFWQRVLSENRRRTLFHRLRRFWSLLFHLLIFALILLALARPEPARFGRGGVSTVLLLDARARMQAVESGGESRFEKARRAAREYVARAGTQNQIAILTAGLAGGVSAPFSDDAPALDRALAALDPTDAGGALGPAIQLARDLLAARGGEKRILLFTDRALDPQPGVECVAVGTPHDNIAITRFAARPLLNSPQTSQILLEVRNFGRETARGNIELYGDDALLDVKPIELAPGARRVEIFPALPRAGRGLLRARLAFQDALAVDNEAFAVLPAPSKSRVLLVTRGNWFIEKMLAADDLITFELLDPEAFKPALAASFDAVILDDALPSGFDLEHTPGDFLFVKHSPYTDATMDEQPLVRDFDAHSPLLRLVTLENVTFLRAARMSIHEDSGWKMSAPLHSFDGPLILTAERGNQRTAAFAFDVSETDLPLRVAFPLLMSNTLQWLAGERSPTPRALRAGEVLLLAKGETVELNHAPISDVFQPRKNGFIPIRAGGDGSWMAVNTFDENESDLRFTAAPRAVARAPFPAFARLATSPGWVLLALTAFALFAAEWWLFHLRRTE